MQKIIVLILGGMVEPAAKYPIFYCRRLIVISSSPVGIKPEPWIYVNESLLYN